MSWIKQFKERRKYRAWVRKGQPAPPPPLAKRKMHLDYAKRFDLSVFVETGTFQGDTVEAMRPFFDRIYSIELADKYYERAVRRFSGVDKVKLLQGDSGQRMPEVVEDLGAATLFYIIAILCQFQALARLPAATAAFILNLEPVVSILLASIILKEQLSNLQWLGVILVISVLVASVRIKTSHSVGRT